MIRPSGTYSYFAGVPDPHGGDLRLAEYNGLLEGLIGLGPSWDVTANATRGEVAQMLWNLFGHLVPAGVWVYADGSGDYPTIEAAVADIATGTTIYLGPGTFRLSQTLAVDFSFNLVGSGMAGPDATVVTCNDTVVDVASVSFSAQDIKFVSTASSKPTDVMAAGDATIDLLRCSFSRSPALERPRGRRPVSLWDDKRCRTGLCLHPKRPQRCGARRERAGDAGRQRMLR